MSQVTLLISLPPAFPGARPAPLSGGGRRRPPVLYMPAGIFFFRMRVLPITRADVVVRVTGYSASARRSALTESVTLLQEVSKEVEPPASTWTSKAEAIVKLPR
ncbi:hypothetical protein GCM10010412_026740 [Nonomuraea recticatena]|uniref:Uncharacterized protein n=1 Tax=Nonomuraea recticatena TaxID=46178 RepID=A0ABN3RMW9_9ACTN